MLASIVMSCLVGVLLVVSPTLSEESTTTTTVAPNDPEAQVKCDACVLIAKKFSDGFLAAEEKEKTVKLGDKQITAAAEGVCDELWYGYGVVEASGINRLGGPLTGRTAPVPDDEENLWSHRLQDFCDEMMAEVHNDKVLYSTWSADQDNGLESLLCRGTGTFSACTAENYGNWPGDDDYDYDDGDFDYTHDEF